MKNKRLVFMNSGMHFWNRETEILAELNTEYEILLIICHSENKNYLLEDIINFCTLNKISLMIVDNTSRRAKSPLNIFRAIKTLKKIYNFKPDSIYLETFNDPYLAIFCSLFLNKSKVIISIMDYELHPYEQNEVRLSDKFYQFIYLKFFKNFQLFSSQQANLMQKSYPSKNIFYIPLFLIKNDFKISDKNNNSQSEFINFLFLGKIHYYKGLDILIKAGNILASRYANFKIIIAGDCDDFTRYEKQIKNYDVFELKIYYLSKEEIQELMMKADILVLPYRQVTQSGPLMMAFNFGIIPLTSDLSGFQELIKNESNGFLFQKNSVDELVKIMEKIILMSKFGRDIIRKNLIKYVSENYDLSKFVNNYKLMFDSVSGNK
jgi:glycosyltransferase involved in cell wall biosynthesis